MSQDAFDEQYQKRYGELGERAPFQFSKKASAVADGDEAWIEGPEGFAEKSFEYFERAHRAQLNEAFRLGYRAALMEKP